MLDTEVFGQLLFQLFVEGATVGQAFTVPDPLQVRDELLQRRE